MEIIAHYSGNKEQQQNKYTFRAKCEIYTLKGFRNTMQVINVLTVNMTVTEILEYQFGIFSAN